jgi:hypothetical protein
MPKILVFASVLDSPKQALFLFPENIFIHGQKFLITPRGRCVYFAHEARCATSPPLILSPQVTLTYWEEDINAYQMHSFSPGNATTLFISFSSHLREKGHLPVTFFDSLKYRQLAVLSFWYSYAKI